MRLRTNFALAVGLLATLLWSPIVHAEPSVYPTGVTRYDPAKAYNIFVLAVAIRRPTSSTWTAPKCTSGITLASQAGLLTPLSLVASGVT